MRARRLLLAAAVAVAPALQVAGMASHPHMEGHHVLDVVGADPQRWLWVHAVAALAAMTYLVALPALAGLPRRSGALLATVGAVVAVAGSVCLAAGFVGEAHMLPIVAGADLERSAAEGLVALEEESLAFRAIGLGLPLAGIGQLLLAVGLLRSRVVAWWKPALVVAGLLASLAVPPGEVLGAWLMGLAVLGYVALAVDVARGPREPRPGRRQRRGARLADRPVVGELPVPV